MKIKIFLYSICLSVLVSSCYSKKQVYYPQQTTPKSVAKKPAESVIITKEEVKTEVRNSVYAREILERKPQLKIATLLYIDVFSGEAMAEMRKFKIPASIKLAQAIVESNSGQSHLSLKSNNHFGVKCHKEWEGQSVSHDDDSLGECFRKYDDPKLSFIDHSAFLTSRPRYSKLFTFKENDYISWAYGLKEAGYATDKLYPLKLIKLIEDYELYRFDEQVLGYSTKVQTPDVIAVIEHEVIKGDTLYSISKKYNFTVEELIKLNNLNGNQLSIGQKLKVSK
ncbi:MAG TPA: glucosaminidase domain-containing protein [Flavobacteriaceae bacterium]|nr:glucosaminidase domain-containing protein [Flavobacteriaceae bacterium]